LTHAEIVVGTPYNNITHTIRPMPTRMRMFSSQPFNLGKMAISVLVMQIIKAVCKDTISPIRHGIIRYKSMNKN
jgi:hypothetical protein